MNWSDELKVVWITPMRTGTRSSGEIMWKLNFKTTDNKRPPIHSISVPIGKEDYYLVFNCRNPYSRMVSMFYLTMSRENNFNQTFRSWVDWNFILMEEYFNIFLYPRIKMLPKTPDYFVRIESFSEDIKSIWFVKENEKILSDVIENNINKNGFDKEFSEKGFDKKNSWKEYYDEEIADVVYKKLKIDFDYFNYDKNSWK